MDGFVAHEDIEPTAEWKDVIEAALHSCDAMCALLTVDFPKSPWCDQECGVVTARGIVIVPVDLGKKPYGFVNKFQALPVSAEDSGSRSPMTFSWRWPRIVRPARP